MNGAQLSDTSCNSIYGEHPVPSGVPVLFNVRSPFNISRLVVSVVVYPLYLVSRCWRLANIIRKSLKRVAPFGTNANPPPAVSVVTNRVLVAASLNHCFPSLIQQCVRHTVRGVCFGNALLMVASTGLCISRPKHIGPHLQQCSALAFAWVIQSDDSSINPVLFCKSYGFWRTGDCKPCKYGGDWNSFSGRHIIGSFNVVFSGGCQLTLASTAPLEYITA